MYYVAVTLKVMPCNREVDLDLPWQMPLPEFLASDNGLKQVIRSKMPDCVERILYTQAKNKMMWKLEKKARGYFVPLYTHTLRGAGIYDGDYLIARLYEVERNPYQYYLEVFFDDQRDIERIYLFDDEIIIGRNLLGDKGPPVHVDVSVFLPTIARYISRRHLRIKRDEHGFYVQDLGSQNGTILNGTPIHSGERRPSAPYRLNNGDEITLAKRVTFKFYNQEASQFQEIENRGQP